MKKEMAELILQHIMCIEDSLSINNLKKVPSVEMFVSWKIFCSWNSKKKCNWNCAASSFV